MRLITVPHTHTHELHTRTLVCVCIINTHITLHSEPFSMVYLQRVRCRHLNKCERNCTSVEATATAMATAAAAQTECPSKYTHTHSLTQTCAGLAKVYVCVCFIDSPCACVHFSRKTMNTKRKSISQFFTVFRLEIKWLKKRCKSIYLLFTHTRTHTRTRTLTACSLWVFVLRFASFAAGPGLRMRSAAAVCPAHHTHIHTRREGYTHTRPHAAQSLQVALPQKTWPLCLNASASALPLRLRDAWAPGLPPGGSCSCSCSRRASHRCARSAR